MGTATKSRTSCRVNMRDLEAALRANNMPFVVMREVQRAVFVNGRLPEVSAFDFLVYQAYAPNLLVSTKPRNCRMAHAMLEWQAIFGDDFQVAFVRWSADGHLQARDINGNPLPTEVDNLVKVKKET